MPVSVNTTSGAFSFTAAVVGIPGATLLPGSGTAPGTVILNLDVTALAPGTYVGVLSVSAPDSANQTASVPVTVTILPPAPIPTGDPERPVGSSL